MPQKVSCADCGKFCYGERCRACYIVWASSVLWQNPEYRRKQSEAQTEAQNRPEVKAKKSETITKIWNELKYRQQIVNAVTEIWDMPQFRERVSRGMAAAHARGDFGSPATRQKKSESAKAMWQNPDYRQKQVKAQLEAQNRPEVKKKQSDAHKGKKNPRWRGGISREPYSLDWPKVGRDIRERDGYRCRVCNEFGKCVHHVDYNPGNNDPVNLITLCRPCHNKTTFGNRDYWQSYFTRVSYNSILEAIPCRGIQISQTMEVTT